MKGILRVLPLTLGLILPPAFSGAPGDQTGSLRLEELLEQMLARNPDLLAARKRWEAMQKRPGQAGALPDPTLRLGYTSVGSPLPGAGLGSAPMASLGIGVAQGIPFPGKRGLRSAIAEREAESESFVYEATRRNLINRMKRAFHELEFVHSALEILGRNRSLLGRLAQAAEFRYVAGTAMQQDLIKSQVEISIIGTRILEVERRKGILAAEINALLDRDVDAPLGRPGSPDEPPPLPSPEYLKQRAVQTSPALRARKAMIDGRQLGSDLARREYYPDFEVMGGYGNQGSMKDAWEFRVQLNLPLFFARKQRLGLEESGARLAEARKTYRAEEQRLQQGIREAWLEAETARRLMELYSKTIVPQATLALESSLASYGTGKVDFLSVLSNFTAVLEHEMNYHQNRARYLQALAGLEELSGESLAG
ncbi:MAG: TolC family protein [Acidobacteria bacterium]|nr:TolC family protein [Acidobacteriota bacterium]